MHRPIKYQTILLLSALMLIGLSCNIINLSGGSTDSNNEVQVQQGQEQEPVEQQQSEQEPHAPTQALPRPTRPEGQSSLPKPTIPAPPTQSTRQPEDPPPQNEQPQPPPETEGEAGAFYIVNDTYDSVICYFYLALSSDPEWGPDQLGEEDVIYAGETYTLNSVPSGTFDAQALDCDGEILAEVFGFDFPQNDTFTLFDE